MVAMGDRWGDTLRTTPYFAFVEGVEEIGKSAAPKDAPEWWRQVLQKRKPLPLPTHCIWMDCVRVRDFLELDWRFEACEIGDVKQGDTRRDRIMSLPGTMFRIVVVLLSKHSAAEAKILTAFNESAWHRIILGPRPGAPAVVGPDFDLEEGGIEYLKLEHYGACPPDERGQLLNVFNLNFIPDAEFGSDGDSASPSPMNPPGSDEVAISETTYKALVRGQKQLKIKRK